MCPGAAGQLGAAGAGSADAATSAPFSRAQLQALRGHTPGGLSPLSELGVGLCFRQDPSPRDSTTTAPPPGHAPTLPVWPDSAVPQYLFLSVSPGCAHQLLLTSTTYAPLMSLPGAWVLFILAPPTQGLGFEFGYFCDLWVSLCICQP